MNRVKKIKKILNKYTNYRKLNRKHKFRRNNNFTRKIKYNFSTKTQTLGPGSFSINLTTNFTENFVQGDLPRYKSISDLIKLNSEWTDFAGKFSIFKIRKIGVTIYPNDTLNNYPTYINLDWFGNIDSQVDLESLDSTKIIYNELKRVKTYTFRPPNIIINSSFNPRMFNTIDKAIPGVLYFHQFGGSLIARVDINVLFKVPNILKSSSKKQTMDKFENNKVKKLINEIDEELKNDNKKHDNKIDEFNTIIDNIKTNYNKTINTKNQIINNKNKIIKSKNNKIKKCIQCIKKIRNKLPETPINNKLIIVENSTVEILNETLQLDNDIKDKKIDKLIGEITNIKNTISKNDYFKNSMIENINKNYSKLLKMKGTDFIKPEQQELQKAYINYDFDQWLRYFKDTKLSAWLKPEVLKQYNDYQNNLKNAEKSSQVDLQENKVLLQELLTELGKLMYDVKYKMVQNNNNDNYDEDDPGGTQLEKKERVSLDESLSAVAEDENYLGYDSDNYDMKY